MRRAIVVYSRAIESGASRRETEAASVGGANRVAVAPLRPRARASEPVRRHFVRGREHPRGVVWFGVRSFWGHLRHFLASAIATEDVDSRDWMTSDPPQELVTRVAEALGSRATSESLVEALGRDLWVDYVADTGDDVAVSRSVARLIFAPYELPDPERAGEQLLAPRGDLLIFGGDTAYPVATAQEITNRVLVPFNQILESLPDVKPRVLLGIPGNHDWYDGLDGFARMFRRRFDDAGDAARPSIVGISQPMLEHYAEWARQFVHGGKVEKPKALLLSGYTAVQGASYFVLPLTRALHLVAVDRQLRNLDYRQCHFVRTWLGEHPEITPWLLFPDPVYAFGEPSATGTAMVEALGLDFEAKPHFILSGDVHHYERLQQRSVLHVTAGGGGAFLHPAPVARTGRLKPDVEWPNARQSRVLLWKVPWKIMCGRSGVLPHMILGVLFVPVLSIGVHNYDRLGLIVPMPIAVTLVMTLVYALIGGVRSGRRLVFLVALIAGLATAMVPLLGSFAFTRLARYEHWLAPAWLAAAITFVVAVFSGCFVFGAYLSALTWLGLEHTQAFTALDHPGFKHFLRLRVRADASAVDVWCLGLADPLAPDAEPVLVDAVTFRVGDITQGG